MASVVYPVNNLSLIFIEFSIGTVLGYVFEAPASASTLASVNAPFLALPVLYFIGACNGEQLVGGQ